MSDDKIILRLLVTTILLAWCSVVGLTSSLCGEMSCGCRMLCGLAGMACGAILFVQIACVQIARYYLTEFEGRASAHRA